MLCAMAGQTRRADGVNTCSMPRSSKAARWWEVDMSMWVIVTLEKLGLVWNVQRPNLEAQPRQRKLPAKG